MIGSGNNAIYFVLKPMGVKANCFLSLQVYVVNTVAYYRELWICVLIYLNALEND